MIYELTLFTSYFNQSCVNRWNYLMTGTPAAVTGSFALLNAVGAIVPTLLPGTFPDGTMYERIRELSHNATSFTASVAKAVYDVTDFYELPYVPAVPGAQTGEGASPMTAYGYRSTRSRTDIRRGMKRFVGVPMNVLDSGGLFDAGGAGGMADVAELMSEVLTYTDEGNDLTFSPIIVSKERRPVPDKDTFAYYYYPTEAEQMEHIAQSILWQPYASVRSQTSRQYGRGQ